MGIIGNGASFSPLEVTRLHTDFSPRLPHIMYTKLIIFTLLGRLGEFDEVKLYNESGLLCCVMN